MFLKEEVEDPKIIQRISAILIPREFTKLDEIIDLVFSTAVDVKEEALEQEADEIETEKKGKPVSFHEACIKRIETKLEQTFIKRSRTTYSTADESLRISCAVSKMYDRSGQVYYWFAFHPHQKEFLEKSDNSFVAFGCGSEDNLLLIPLSEFVEWLDDLNVTQEEHRFYWHVNITQDNNQFILYPKKGASRRQLNKYLV